MTKRSLDELLQLVADRDRRLTIQQLRRGASGITKIDDLVDAMLDRGSGTDEQTIEREQLVIQLYHAHLPKLADHGIVEFEPDNRTVRYQQDEQVETVLDSLPGELPVAHP